VAEGLTVVVCGGAAEVLGGAAAAVVNGSAEVAAGGGATVAAGALVVAVLLHPPSMNAHTIRITRGIKTFFMFASLKIT